MRSKTLIAKIGLGVVSGFVGTKLMEPVSMKLYELEPAADRQREDAVRPGLPYQIAAQKTAKLLGIKLTGQRLEQAGLLFHYGLGMSWGLLYPLLYRPSGLPPLPSGLLTGASLSLLIDEGLTPTLGFSAPNRAYPLITHLRGFIAHLVYGFGVAITAEGLTWLVNKSRQGRSSPEHWAA